MAVSICNTPMNKDNVFNVGRIVEGTIQIVIPPKPNAKNTGKDKSSSYSTQESDPAPKLNNFLSLTSLYHEEDLASSKLPFVWKLYEMLEDVNKNGKDHIVSWVADGKAFKVHKLKLFVDDIIPRYFRQSKYKSFQRQLYFYGFSRVQSGVDTGAYSHPNFVRGLKTMCLSMTPKKTSRRSSKKKSTMAENAQQAVEEIKNMKNGPPHDETTDPSEWMTQMESLMTYGADPGSAQQRRRSSAYESIDPTALERAGPSDGDTVFVFGGKPFHFVETEFADLPSC